MNHLITGASGQLGRLVAEHLLASIPAEQLILVTRDPGRLSDLAQRGAQVRQGDFSQPEGLAEAFAGADRVLLISTDAIGARVAQHGAAIDAAVAVGARFVAYTSVINPTDSNPVAVAPEHRATEQLLRDSGLAWSFLRNSVYADLQIDFAAAAVAQGTLITNSGPGRVAFVTRADCAATAAAVLRDPAQDNTIHDITGPDALSADDLAQIYGEVAGCPVSVTQMDDQAYTAALMAAGLPTAMAEVLASFGRATREGHLDARTDTVAQFTGHQATPLRELVRSQRARLG